VHLEGAIGEAEDARAARGADRAQDLLPGLGAVGVDRELADALSLRSGAGVALFLRPRREVRAALVRQLIGESSVTTA